jgi:hypothetical protein
LHLEQRPLELELFVCVIFVPISVKAVPLRESTLLLVSSVPVGAGEKLFVMERPPLWQQIDQPRLALIWILPI